MTDLETGMYRHHKGALYEVEGTVVHTETLAIFALYKNSEGIRFVRPLEMFLEEVEVDGRQVPRFERIDNN